MKQQNREVNDPYEYIALQVIRYAFSEIKNYYQRRGTREEILGGYEAIKWIRRMDGNFKLYAQVTHLPLEKFHQLCLNKINIIKQNVGNKKSRQEED